MTTTAEVQARHDAYEEVIDNYNAIAGALKIAPIEHTDRGYLLEQLEQMKPYIQHLRTCPSYSLATDACIGRKCTCGLHKLLEVKS
jgi:hypothetical protein